MGCYQKLVKEAVIPYQEKALRDEIPGVEKSHTIENFRQAARCWNLANVKVSSMAWYFRTATWGNFWRRLLILWRCFRTLCSEGRCGEIMRSTLSPR